MKKSSQRRPLFFFTPGIVLLCAFFAIFVLISSSAWGSSAPTVRVAVLAGPTGMGFAPLMERSRAGESSNTYEFSVAHAPDSLVGRILNN